MTKDELNDEYFQWMYRLVCSKKYSRGLSYRKLFKHLHNREFVYIVSMDSNRAEDGIGLRYRFGYERNYDYDMVAAYLDTRPCSVLEMLIALSLRCEEHIMDDPDIGDRTGEWFFSMIKNLGLNSMNNAKYDERYVDDIITRFLRREYGRNGEGGLFTVSSYHCKHDLRTAEIWYQMCWYLGEVI